MTSQTNSTHDNYCTFCGQEGHRASHCPRRRLEEPTQKMLLAGAGALINCGVAGNITTRIAIADSVWRAMWEVKEKE